MTVAVCVSCGAIKHGAFNPCEACAMQPESETDLAYSLALTDHYFSIDTLKEISNAMLAGKPRPSLPVDQENHFRQAVQTYVKTLGKVLGHSAFSSREESTSSKAKIQIHPAGQGNSTDYDLFSQLESSTPRSCRKVQDLLVAAERFNKGPGLFRSRKSLTLKLQREIYALKEALEYESLPSVVYSSPVELLFSYLSKFSDACPNCQAEYETLNRFIPKCF